MSYFCSCFQKVFQSCQLKLSKLQLLMQDLPKHNLLLFQMQKYSVLKPINCFILDLGQDPQLNFYICYLHHLSNYQKLGWYFLCKIVITNFLLLGESDIEQRNKIEFLNLISIHHKTTNPQRQSNAVFLEVGNRTTNLVLKSSNIGLIKAL